MLKKTVQSIVLAFLSVMEFLFFKNRKCRCGVPSSRYNGLPMGLEFSCSKCGNREDYCYCANEQMFQNLDAQKSECRCGRETNGQNGLDMCSGPCQDDPEHCQCLSMKTKITAIAAAFLIMLCARLYAAPTVTGVTGKLQMGQTIDIVGNGFGVKSPAMPEAIHNGSQYGTNPNYMRCIKRNWDQNENMKFSNQAPDPYKLSLVGTWTSTLISFSVKVNKTPSWSRAYMFVKRYYTHPVTNSQKCFRIWPLSGPNNFVASYVNGSFVALNENDTSNPDIYGGGVPANGVWHTEEIRWQHSGGTGKYRNGQTGTGTGIFDYRRNGVQVHHQEAVNNGPNNLVELRPDNFTDLSHAAPAGAKVYMHDLYIDSVYSRVMIGNASTYANSTRLEIQYPLVWQDGTVRVTLNQGAFADGEQAYLFVFDASNAPSAGFPITFLPH